MRSSILGDGELAGLLIKIGAVMFIIFSILQLLSFAFWMVLGPLLGPLLSEIPILRGIVLVGLGLLILGILLSLIGVVIGIKALRVADIVERGYLSKRERDKWLIVVVTMLILSAFTGSWLPVIGMVLILTGLILAPTTYVTVREIRQGIIRR